MEKNANGYELPENVKELIDAATGLMAQAEKVKQSELMRLSAYGTDIHSASAILMPFDEIFDHTNSIVMELSIYVARIVQEEAYGKLTGKGSL